MRFIVDAILWYLRVGAQWRNLPEIFPDWRSVYYYFRKWKADGTLENMNLGLDQLERLRIGIKAIPAMICIASQSINTPFVKEERGIDGNKKVNGRKCHVITDTRGIIWGVVVHAANKHDGVMAERVVSPLQGYMHRMRKILADDA